MKKAGLFLKCNSFEEILKPVLSLIVFKSLFIGIGLFFLSPGALCGFGGLPFSSFKPIISENLRKIFVDLKIDMERLSPDEIRFLENSLNESPLWMLENEKGRHAIFQTTSSYADQAYRRLFFSRLNPHSKEEMSGLFNSLRDYRDSIYNKLLEGRSGNVSNSPRRDRINAWRKATDGILSAIKNRLFKISMSDFHALYANHVSEKLGDPNFFRIGREHAKTLLEEGIITADQYDDLLISEEAIKTNYAIHELMDFFQGTKTNFFQRTTRRTSRRGNQDPAISIASTFHRIRRAGAGRNYDEASQLTTQFFRSKEERYYLDIMKKMFVSPFYRPSEELRKLFNIICERNLDILNNADFILRLWSSGIEGYRGTIKVALELNIGIAVKRAGGIPEEEIIIFLARRNLPLTNNDMIATPLTPKKMEEIHTVLSGYDFFKAITEAAKESDEIADIIDVELKEWSEYLLRDNRS